MTTSLPQKRSGKAPPSFCLFALALATVGVVPAFGNTITVTNTNDSGAGSLRDAIATAASGDTINFSSNISYPATITISSNSLSVCNVQNLSINGPGASKLAISGGGSIPVLTICLGTNAAISGVTIENGNSAGGSVGGGISNSGTLTLANSTLSGNYSVYQGGAIANSGMLTITNSTLSGNSTHEQGGAIYNSSNATLTITNSTLSGNSSDNDGGGIYNDAGTLAVTNSTLSGNSAISGGGIYSYSGTFRMTNSTLSGNSADYGGGIANDVHSAATLKSTLLASNAGGNCALFTPLTSAGYNLSDDATCSSAFTQTGDKNSTAAGLDPKGLQNNGGPTQTIALLPGSPAVDAIPPASCTDTNGNPVTTDQRGVTRPQGAGCDIGAFELVQAVPFCDFDAFLAIQTGQHSGFALGAWFTLGSASDGIHPLTEAVTLQIANYTVTIPAGSFHKLWNGSQAPYGYEGTINGTKLVVGIIPLGGNKYQFDAAGSPVVWNGVKNPVTVSLTIGNDTGSTQVKAVISTR